MSEDSQRYLYIPHAGPSLLETPLLNKGSAFNARERAAFNLTGLVPPRYETIEEQVERAYMQYSSFDEALNKHIYLRASSKLLYCWKPPYLIKAVPLTLASGLRST